jgi:anti-sigma B factor antagonist
VSLSLQSRAVGEITVVTCHGRIVEGEETAALDSCVTRLLPLQPHIVLDLGGVSFVDSAGLGLLVRLHSSSRAAGGDLKLCALDERVRAVFAMTRLDTVLPPYQSDAKAVTAFYAPADAERPAFRLDVDILCVHASTDVLAYLCEVLRQAGYGVTSTTNAADARTLLNAMRPRVAVVGSEFRSRLVSSTPDSASARATRIVWLPDGFSTEEAGEAAQRLLEGVREAMVN